MPSLVETRPFGLQPVPFARLPEAIASLKAPEKTARVDGRGIWDGSRFFQWPNRDAMARQIRRDQRTAPHSRYIPVVPLTYREGY